MCPQWQGQVSHSYLLDGIGWVAGAGKQAKFRTAPRLYRHRFSQTNISTNCSAFSRSTPTSDYSRCGILNYFCSLLSPSIRYFLQHIVLTCSSPLSLLASNTKLLYHFRTVQRNIAKYHGIIMKHFFLIVVKFS